MIDTRSVHHLGVIESLAEMAPIFEPFMLHVYINKGRDHVAMINRQHPGSDGYQPQLPYLLLLDDGRVRRFPNRAEAKDEAMKLWSPVVFKVA